MYSLIALILALAPELARGHGVMTKPISRSLYLLTNETNGMQFAGECPGGSACQWYTQKTTTPGEVTNCDAAMRTMGVNCGDENPTDFPCTAGAAVPWCAPGSAQVASPCGIYSGTSGGTRGRDMRDLPAGPADEWVAGGVAEVAWAITANHGGGYAYRLCPAGESDLSEACFQQNHLAFAGDSSSIVDPEGNVVAKAPAVRTIAGTVPAGSEWARNPFPMEDGAIEPIPGLEGVFGRGPFNYSVVDLVAVPSSLAPGPYVLSWRWDAEQTKQVWSQCSDVVVVAPGKSGATRDSTSSTSSARSAGKPRPQPQAADVSAVLPSGAAHLCSGSSLGLDVRDCDAWVDLYDAAGGADWPETWRAGCPGEQLRTDPCGCNGYWQKNVKCSDKRDLKRITELYLLGSVVTGPVPPSLLNLTALVALSLVGTSLSGPVPPTLFDALPLLEMVWLDHNPRLTGTVPASLARLPIGQVSALELHGSGFGGALPDGVDWTAIPDCTLNGLVFDCPLPPGAETCGAACA